MARLRENDNDTPVIEAVDESFLDEIIDSLKMLSQTQKDIYHQVEELRTEHNNHNNQLVSIQGELKVQANVITRIENVVSEIKTKCYTVHGQNNGLQQPNTQVIIGGEEKESGKQKIVTMLLNPVALALIALILALFSTIIVLGLKYVKIDFGDGKKEVIIDTDSTKHNLKR